MQIHKGLIMILASAILALGLLANIYIYRDIQKNECQLMDETYRAKVETAVLKRIVAGYDKTTPTATPSAKPTIVLKK